MNSSKNLSLWVLVFIGVILSLYRITNVSDKEISWDVLGYYMPLPATFVHHDPLLNDVGWLYQVNDEKALTGTLYMISSNDEGEPMYFFLLGMSFFYLPFFLFAHLYSLLEGLPADGFTSIYQYSLVIGGIFYTIVGLFFLRKNLRHFFSETITAVVMLILVFATNYIHHLTIKNLETVNVLFMLVNIVLWYTIKWHEDRQLKHMVFIGAGVTLMGLVKPSEVVIILLPLLWGIDSKTTLKEKIKLVLDHKEQLLITIGAGLLIASPQMLYWLIKTGMPVYDSYKNPGVGLDLFSPHIMDVLFSFRKGWLIYTPVMLFALAGFPLIFKQNKKIFFATLVYFLVSFYIISSWSEWWYGAGFSNRPLITVYPVLAISLGYFLEFVTRKGRIWQIVFGVFILFFTFLNQFQWWKFRNYIIDPTRTTKDYYWSVFLKTSVKPEEEKLLLVKRSYWGKELFEHRENYRPKEVQNLTFDEGGTQVQTDSTGRKFYRVTDDEIYILTRAIPYNSLTGKDHLWVEVQFDLRYPEGFDGPWPCAVINMDHKDGSYGYYAPEIKPDSLHHGWQSYRFDYLTPEIRNRKDKLKFYIWKRGKKGFEMDNFKVTVFEKTTP